MEENDVLKLLRDNMEETRDCPLLKDWTEKCGYNFEPTVYVLGWNACLDRLCGIIDEMIGDE